jgi:hypothetical protein
VIERTNGATPVTILADSGPAGRRGAGIPPGSSSSCFPGVAALRGKGLTHRLSS